jgi:Na+/citrate or Na+/malate symporter
MKRVLIATFAGGLAYFLLGGLIYVVILGGFYEANLGSATGVLREVPIGWAMILSQLGLAALVTYVFLHADVATASDGLRTGAIFGLLFGIAMALDLYGVTNWSNLTVALVEPFVTTVRIALGGAVIGWTLGMGKGREIESSMGV